MFFLFVAITIFEHFETVNATVDMLNPDSVFG
jgi:hypothetical protein